MEPIGRTYDGLEPPWIAWTAFLTSWTSRRRNDPRTLNIFGGVLRQVRRLLVMLGAYIHWVVFEPNEPTSLPTYNAASTRPRLTH